MSWYSSVQGGGDEGGRGGEGGGGGLGGDEGGGGKGGGCGEGGGGDGGGSDGGDLGGHGFGGGGSGGGDGGGGNGEGGGGEGGEGGGGGDGYEYVPHWVPSLTVSMVEDFTAYPDVRHVPRRVECGALYDSYDLSEGLVTVIRVACRRSVSLSGVARTAPRP